MNIFNIILLLLLLLLLLILLILLILCKKSKSSFKTTKLKSDLINLNIKLHFISYGDDKYKNSKIRIKNEVKSLDIFNKINIYEPHDIDILFNTKYKKYKECYNILKTQKRGGGYWLWKPIIIYEELLLMNDNDILIYADAGCKIYNKIDNIIDNLKFKNTCDLSVYNTQKTGGYIKKIYNLNVVKNIIKMPINNVDKFINNYEVESNRIIIRKTNKSMKIIYQWLYYALNYPIYFTDYNIKLQNDESIDHRHDQSIFNLLLFNNDCLDITKYDITTWIKAERIRK